MIYLEVLNKKEIISSYIQSIPLLISGRYDKLTLEKQIDKIIMVDNYFQISAMYFALKLGYNALVNHLLDTKPNQKMAQTVMITAVPIKTYIAIYNRIKSSIAIRMLQDPMSYLAIVYGLTLNISDVKYLAREFNVSSGIIREMAMIMRTFNADEKRDINEKMKVKK